ncbi:MAG: sulfite oxidase [Gemmatimonadota bacterium]
MELRTVTTEPFNAETPLAALGQPLTPTPLFYVRNNFDVPRIDPSAWRLLVEGEVEAPLQLSLADLRGMPQRDVTVTLECAGNDRTRMSPIPSGTPWGLGAVGTATFVGTSLAGILEAARLRPGALEAVFAGADEGEVQPGRRERFVRSLPLEEARRPDVLLAWSMNGEPLTPDHGFPLRLLVPGWYGVASVKWLSSLTLAAEPFRGYFQRERYVYEAERGTPDGTPVRRMRVRALVARPENGAAMRRGLIDVAGTAWSGEAAVARVEVSVDGGASWDEAMLGEGGAPGVATPWRFTWHAQEPGFHVLSARATDAAGRTQPLEPVWNAHGYGNNAVQRVRVSIV